MKRVSWSSLLLFASTMLATGGGCDSRGAVAPSDGGGGNAGSSSFPAGQGGAGGAAGGGAGGSADGGAGGAAGGGAGGAAGGGAGGAAGGTAGAGGAAMLTPNADGRFDGTNPWGIVGSWYSFADAYNSLQGPTLTVPGDCPAAGFSTADCSQVTPAPGAGPLRPVNGKVCVSGTAAKVILKPGASSPAYDAIWGAGVGFDFNNALAYDAPAHGISGFSFDIDMTPLGGNIRVELSTTTQSGGYAAYWGGARNNLSPLSGPGRYQFTLATVGGPFYLASPPLFDPTKVVSMGFFVVTNTAAVVPFSFCISNLRPLP